MSIEDELKTFYSGELLERIMPDLSRPIHAFYLGGKKVSFPVFKMRFSKRWAIQRTCKKASGAWCDTYYEDDEFWTDINMSA